MKKMMILMLLAFVSLGRISAQNSPAVILSDKPGWHKIGEKTVDLTMDKDEIMVMGADRFSSLKFKVKDEPIELASLEIFFEAGDKEVVAMNTTLNANTESRVIDIKGGERELKKIVFHYKTLQNAKNKKAHVEIWGYKAAPK